MSTTSKEGGVKLSFCISFKRPFKDFFRRKKPRAQEPIALEKRTDDGPTAPDALKALEDQLAETKAEFARFKAEAAEEKRGLEDQLRQANELLESQKKELGNKDADIQQLGRDCEVIRTKLVELRGADTRAQQLSTRLVETEKLLNERTTELSAAQVFLTKVDAVSEAEVVGMIDNLNTLICSASGALSDTWDQREPIPGTLTDESDVERIRQDFGDLMAEQIAARNTVAVNLAIQMHLGQFIEQITSGWGDGPAAGNLAEIYGVISTQESQTVASRWRTLTKRYTPHQKPPSSEGIINSLARILLVTQSFSDSTEAAESVEQSAGAEINAIIEATVQLDDVIKTKVASSDMYVYVVLRGSDFSEEAMEDEFGGDGSKGTEGPATVAGTMEVGLLQRSGNVEKVLRRPKVILEPDLVEPEDGNNE